LQKSIWRVKDRMWNDYLKKLRGAEVWRVQMYAIPLAEATKQAQTERDGKRAVTFTGNEEIFGVWTSPPKEDK
jgi:hypothetical protein